MEVHALLVDRLQPQILIIEFAKTALPGAAPSPIYGFKPHVSSQNVGQIPNYVLLVIQSSPSLLHLLFIMFIITNHPESVVGGGHIIIPIITIHEIHYSRHPHIIL